MASGAVRKETQALALVVVVALIAGLGLFLFRARADARSALVERFRDRGRVAARFIEAYVRDLARREIDVAERELDGKRVSTTAFREAAKSLEFTAAVLLDENGRVLHSLPKDPALKGKILARRYEHLATALTGRVGVSNVVPSAVEGEPIVAVAVPFHSEAGRRVLSGTVVFSRTALGRSYLANISPVRGAKEYLIDADGRTLASSIEDQPALNALREQSPELADAIESRSSGSTVVTSEPTQFDSQRVGGTPWRLVTAAPEQHLFAPLGGTTALAPWLVFVAFVAAAVTATIQLKRIAMSRATLTRVNEQLETTNKEIELYARSQRHFIAAASHELRTPLTSILGYLELVEEGDLPQEQRDSVEVVSRNAQRLLRLVDSLLALLRMESRPPKRDRIDVGELAAEAVESARPAASRKEVQLHFSAEPAPVIGDAEQLAQALDNLLSNAVKYTPERGQVHVTVTTSNSSVVATVADTGIGVPEEERGNLFSTFFRTSTAVASGISGSGLGLSITRSIVEAHGGRIGVEHLEGGTAFSIELPLAADE